MIIKSRFVSKAVIGATIFVLVLTPIWWLTGDWYRDNLIAGLRVNAALNLSYRADELSAAINRRVSLVDGLYAFVSTSISDIDFEDRLLDFSAGLISSIPGIRNISVAPEGIVTFVYPLEGNESLLGYQPIFDPRSIVRDDVRRAIERPQIVISGPLELVTGGVGMIFTRSIYKDDVFWGLVRIVVEYIPIIDRAGLEEENQGLRFALRDKTGQTIFGSNDIFYRDPVIRRIAFVDEVWELAGVPSGGWDANVRDESIIFRFITLLMVGLISGLIYLFVNRHERYLESERRRKVAEGLREVLSVLNSNKSLRIVLDNILDQTTNIMNASACALYRYQKTKGILELTHSYGFPTQLGDLKGIPLPATSSAREVLDGKLYSIETMNEEIPPTIEETLDSKAKTWQQVLGGQYHSNLTVPVTMKGEIYGCLTLYYSLPIRFSNEIIGLAIAFADQAALAIENTTYHEQSKVLASLQERHKISRDLHDSLSQVLYSIGLGARTAKEMINQFDKDSGLKATISEPIDYINHLAQKGLNEMRDLILDLRPDELDRDGLLKVLEKRVDELKARHPIDWNLVFMSEPELPIQVKMVLLRIAQEAINNILKHAQATKVFVNIAEENEFVKMEIEDNGVGFDLEEKSPGHFGINIMQERAKQIGAVITIDSKIGEGTRIAVLVPLTMDTELSE